jgi:hemerythrin-like domain-containing protein
MDRRNLLTGIGGLGAGLILSSRLKAGGLAVIPSESKPSSEEDTKHKEVSAVEDLMREHGVLRRILVVYSETAEKLRNAEVTVLLKNIQKAASLFRSFGEEYHEKKLEEVYIFPAVAKLSSEAAVYPEILITQHNRGREITDYIFAATRNAKLSAGDSEKLINAMKSLVRMYRAHAAREDTVVFSAWKESLSEEQLDEMSEKFEQIEHQQFGEDGFENAVQQIASIEAELGLADISKFTAELLKI